MAKSRVIVLYHSNKMLRCIHLDVLLEGLLDAFGCELIVEFTRMNVQEQSETSQVVTEAEIRIITELFRILEVKPPGDELLRRHDVEYAINKRMKRVE